MTNFMTICPRNQKYADSMVKGIPLKVILADGIDISPHIKFTEAELDNGAKYFHNNSGSSDSFKVTVIIDTTETVSVESLLGYSTWDGEKYTDPVYMDIGKTKDLVTVLDYFIRKGEPFYVTTRATGIKPKELWLVTENKSRKQKYDDKYVEWDLTFSKVVSYSYATYKNTNKAVTKAMKKYEKKKAKTTAKAKKETAKKKTTKKSKFEKNCKASKLKYSKKKKVVDCVKLMQNILYKKGCFKTNKKSQIDGWYGDVTKDAVKRFQKKYAKKYKLKKTGNIDKATFKALCSV